MVTIKNTKKFTVNSFLFLTIYCTINKQTVKNKLLILNI